MMRMIQNKTPRPPPLQPLSSSVQPLVLLLGHFPVELFLLLVVEWQESLLVGVLVLVVMLLEWLEQELLELLEVESQSLISLGGKYFPFPLSCMVEVDPDNEKSSSSPSVDDTLDVIVDRNR